MPLLPDTAALRARARRVDAAADELTRHSAALRSTAAQIRWVSPGATRFRVRADDLSHDLDRAIDALRHAAAALRAHADSVDHIMLSTLAAPGQALNFAGHIAGGALHLAGLP